jgi:hypothetical protein
MKISKWNLSHDLSSACSRIASWAENWQMRIASNKCIALRITNKVMHVTTSNDRYLLGHEYVNWCTEARDLGILIDNKLSFNQHVSNIAHKAGVRARLILRSFCSKDCRVLLKAYITYVRPLLEYCSLVWSPFTVANINKIEAVQRHFTKNISELSALHYNDRLFNLQLESLELRRLKCDLVTLYKLIHDYFDNPSTKYLEFYTDSCTRGHKYKIRKQYSAVNAYKFSFPQRSIDIWNSLPAAAVESITLSEFKRRLNNVDLTCYCSSFS